MFTVDQEVIDRLNMKIKSMLYEATQKLKGPIKQWPVDFRDIGSNIKEQVEIVWNNSPMFKEYELSWKRKKAIVSKRSS